MIVVRDIFQLKFGKAAEAAEVWRDGRSFAERSGGGPIRLLSDVVGPYYTLILERTYDSLAEFERASQELRSDDEWKDWYARFLPLLEGGHREIFRVVE
jgi:hypothetical protein